jgi:hypothetical protein
MRLSFKLWPKWLKYSAALAGVVFVLSAGIFSWVNYLSPEAKNIVAQRKDIETILKMQRNYEEAMRADTYGGKTPQETLDMFISALKKKDFDLASKYFSLKETGVGNLEWRNSLAEADNKQKVQVILDALRSAKLDQGASINLENDVVFSVRNKDGIVIEDVRLVLNKYANIWKIESM